MLFITRDTRPAGVLQVPIVTKALAHRLRTADPCSTMPRSLPPSPCLLRRLYRSTCPSGIPQGNFLPSGTPHRYHDLLTNDDLRLLARRWHRQPGQLLRLSRGSSLRRKGVLHGLGTRTGLREWCCGSGWWGTWCSATVESSDCWVSGVPGLRERYWAGRRRGRLRVGVSGLMYWEY